MSIKLTATILFFSLFSQTALAEKLLCDMTDFGEGGFVPEKIALLIDDNAGKVRVYDGFINHVYGKALEVDSKVSGNKVRFSWTLEDMPLSSGHETDLRFQATYHRDRSELGLIGLLSGSDNRITGEGHCAPLK